MKHILSATYSKYLAVFSISLLLASQLMAQTVGVGTLSPNPKAIIDIVVPEPASNPQGMLLPRLTKDQRLNMSLTGEEKGMLVYDTENEEVFIWDGLAWQTVGSDALPGGGNTGEVLTWNGVNWGPQYPIQPFLTLIGNELANSFSTVNLSSAAPSDGEVLTWDGTNNVWTSSLIIGGLGDHNATQNIKLNNFWISSSGTNFRGINIGEGYGTGASERIGINIAATTAASHLHLHSAQTFAQLRLTTDGTGLTGTDGLVLDINATAASILNRENTPLYLGTAGQNRFRIDTDGKTSVGSSAAPTTTLDVKGSFAASSTAASGANYIVQDTDYFITVANATTQISLPSAATFPGRTIIVKKTGVNELIITSTSGTIRAWDALVNSYVLASGGPIFYKSIILMSDGTNWNIVSENSSAN